MSIWARPTCGSEGEVGRQGWAGEGARLHSLLHHRLPAPLLNPAAAALAVHGAQQVCLCVVAAAARARVPATARRQRRRPLPPLAASPAPRRAVCCHAFLCARCVPGLAAWLPWRRPGGAPMPPAAMHPPRPANHLDGLGAALCLSHGRCCVVVAGRARAGSWRRCKRLGAQTTQPGGEQTGAAPAAGQNERGVIGKPAAGGASTAPRRPPWAALPGLGLPSLGCGGNAAWLKHEQDTDAGTHGSSSTPSRQPAAGRARRRLRSGAGC